MLGSTDCVMHLENSSMVYYHTNCHANAVQLFAYCSTAVRRTHTRVHRGTDADDNFRGRKIVVSYAFTTQTTFFSLYIYYSGTSLFTQPDGFAYRVASGPAL